MKISESKRIPKFHYDDKRDILYIVVKEGREEEFVEVAEGVNIELNEAGELIGIEIFNASKKLPEIYSRKQEKVRA